MHNGNALSHRVYVFLRRQIEGIRHRGLSAVTHKTLLILGLAAAVLPVFLLRIVRPIVLIRFSGLKAERIGHVTADVELYLCEREVGNHPKAVDLFYYSSPICNTQLKRMIERNVRVLWMAKYLDRVNRSIPGGFRHSIIVNGGESRDEIGIFQRSQIHLSLNRDEENSGQEALDRIGIPNGAVFVCFHVRDSAFMNSSFPGFDWSYHDFRKSRIQDYLPAIEELTQRGYYVVRMGSAVNERLETANPMIIDYASDHRTEFLDIYLFWKCSFYLGSGAGIWAVPAIFRKPLACVNVAPIQHRNTSGSNDLFIPKKLWLPEDRRYMKFSEIFKPGIGNYQRADEYEALGIEHIENTQEEITALAVEMDQRLRGTWQTTDEDEELQERFWLEYRPNQSNGPHFPRLGAQFLRENRDLLV